MLLFINIVKDELLRYLCFSVFLFGRVCVVSCCVVDIELVVRV